MATSARKGARTGTSLWSFIAMIAIGLAIALALWYFFPSEGAIGVGADENKSPTGWSKDGTGSPIDAAANIQTLETLRVVNAGSKKSYDRSAFGTAWSDVDGNKCDTRNDILARDLLNVSYADSKDCTVLTGTLRDPYSGRDIEFMRGRASSSAVQIDHVVALADAWPKGASKWDETTRLQFANDPANLLAVDGPLNSAKGASDASSWLPPNTAFHCSYVAAQVQVKASYDLGVTEAEKQAMINVLEKC